LLLLIRVENIHKSFGDNYVLKGIDATFEAGKTSLIIGTSGSGKTVFMKTMIGLFQPDEGGIYYNDRKFSSLSKKERKAIRNEIGMLFQGSALFDSLSVQDNVRFPLDMFTKMTKAEKQARVEFCLDRVTLKPNSYNMFPGEISGGMMKRVGIARAIVLQPQYLFCDEPNSGLDPTTSLVIDKLIQEITDDFNITTIINTHDMNSVMEIGDKVVFLHQGLKEWEGSNQQVLDSDNKLLHNFIFASEFLKALKESKT